MDINEIVKNILFKDKDNKLSQMIEQEFEKVKTTLDVRLKELEKECRNKVNILEDVIKGNPISVNLGTAKKPKNELVHKKFTTILKVLQSAKRINKNIMLVGPAGSSKSTLVRQVAEALKVEFYPMSVGPQTTKSDLLGYTTAVGEYITTPLRQAFENGGVLLLDEFDTANASVVTILNNLLSNGICSFPDKKVEKHPNFICICACNTYGRGASMDYIGRNKLDGATLDRFLTINIDYDEELEEKLTDNKDWYTIIKKIRDNAERHGLKVIISPRASMQGADLLEAGFNLQETLEMCVLKGVSKDIKVKLLEGIKLSKPKKIEKKNVSDNCIVVDIDFDNNVSCISMPDDWNSYSINGHVDWYSHYNIDINPSYVTSFNNNTVFLGSKIACSPKDLQKFEQEFAINAHTYTGKIDVHINIRFDESNTRTWYLKGVKSNKND